MENLSNATVLVTGGNGFLGGHLVRALFNHVKRVAVFDLRATLFSPIGVQSIHMHGDVRRKDEVDSIFAIVNPDIVFHLAAIAPIGQSMAYPAVSIETCTMGTVNVLEAARRSLKDVVVVCVTTDKVYGDSFDSYAEVHEMVPLRPKHPYEVAKVSSDFCAQMYASAFDVATGIARLGNLYGPFDMEKTRLIPHIITSLLDPATTLEFRSPISSKRNYLWVIDAVFGLISLAHRLMNEEVNIGEPWNFSSDDTLSTAEVFDTIYDIAKDLYPENVLAKPDIKKMSPEELPRLETSAIALDSSKARRLLSWAPRTSFGSGIRDTVEWWYQHGLRKEIANAK